MEKEKKTYVHLKDRTAKNDIKFAGVLSYRHIRIIAWVLLALSQIAIILKLNMEINPDSGGIYQGWINAFSFFSNLLLPLFMLVNFAAIFHKKNDFKKLLLFYGGVALGMYALSNFVVMFYGIRFTNALFDGKMSFWTSSKVFASMMVHSGSSGFVFNIFIDLFLCVLCFFFMNYKPKKYYKDKKIILFRLFILLPILYEVGSIIIKHYAINEYWQITHFTFFLLTSKPPVIFLAFVAITLLMRGFGISTSLFLIVPIVFLLSFIKVHKDTIVDTFIPIVGVGLIVLIYVESIYEVVVNNLPRLIDRIQEFFTGLMGEEEENPTEGGESASVQAIKILLVY